MYKLLTIIFLLAINFSLSARTWENNKGKKIEADLVRYSNGIVYLKMANGKIFKVPLNTLSQADKDYISALIAKQKKSLPLPKSTDLFPVWLNKKWGYINLQGKLAIPAKFETIKYFSEGLSPVKLDGKWGFINTRGEFVIGPKEGLPNPGIEYGEFSEGLAPFKNKDGKWGFINLKGEEVIKAEYEGARPFKEGFAVVKLERSDGFGIGKRAYIDKTGKRLNDKPFNEALDFSEGLGAVNLAGVKGNWGFIDKTGKFVIKPTYHRAYTFNFGLALAMPKEGGGFAFIDRTGKFVLGIDKSSSKRNVGGFTVTTDRVAYKGGVDFNSGVTPMYIEGGWGVFNNKGKRVGSKIKCKGINKFSEGMATYTEEDGDLIGYVNSKGKIAIKPKYKEAGDFRNGHALVKDDRFQMYINLRGHVIWKSPLPK